MIANLEAAARAFTRTGDGRATVEALNLIVFGALGLRATPDLEDACHLLPSAVLERKEGYCVGIAAVYLVLAERLRLPIHAVATPSHVFLRYDDGTVRINIETLKRGAEIADADYIRDLKIPAEGVEDGIFMADLGTTQFLGRIHNNLGVLLSERQDYDAAAREFELALALDERFPAPHYNYGNNLLKARRYREASREFSKSLRLDPTDVWALNNRGLAYAKMGKRGKARRDFLRVLSLDPTFAAARANLEALQRL